MIVEIQPLLHSSLRELSTNSRFPNLGSKNKKMKRTNTPSWFPYQIVKAGERMGFAIGEKFSLAHACRFPFCLMSQPRWSRPKLSKCSSPLPYSSSTTRSLEIQYCCLPAPTINLMDLSNRSSASIALFCSSSIPPWSTGVNCHIAINFCHEPK